MIKKLKQRLTMPINNVQRRRIDRKKLSPLAGGVAGRLQQMTQIGNERVNSQAKIPFRERSSFRAFVLAILSEEATATYQSRAENSVFMDQAKKIIFAAKRQTKKLCLFCFEKMFLRFL